MAVTRSLRCIVLALVGCAAHGPRPQALEPDEELPARPTIASEIPTLAEAPAPPEPPEPVADAPEPPPTSPPYERGKQAAAADVATNALALETFGYPAACRERYAKILHDRYRVHLRTVAGCVVDEEILEHVRGYNEVMVAEIERRHGAGVLDRVAQAAGCG